MTNSCSNCDSLQRQLDQILKELAETKKELAIVRRILNAIYSYCDSRAGGNTDEMKGNIPKGQWEFLKGELETANKVLEIMGQHAYAIKKKSKNNSGIRAFGGIFRGMKW